MFFLESFSKGEAPETGKIMEDLGDHTFGLMHTEVSRCASRLDYLMQLANSTADVGRGWNSAWIGLTSPGLKQALSGSAEAVVALDMDDLLSTIIVRYACEREMR